MKRDFKSVVPRGVVVSVQLDDSEPLHTAQHCALFARAAMLGGASAIRAESLENLAEIRATVRLPLIGCVRTKYPDGSPLVTPDLATVEDLIRVGCDVVALDATARMRPGQTIGGTRFVAEIRKEYPELLILADVSTFEEGIRAIDVGADALSTVLFGRTPATYNLAGSLDSHLDLLYRLSTTVSHPVFAEGFVWQTDEATSAMESGAYLVVVGGAITRPRVLTRLFVERVDQTRP